MSYASYQGHIRACYLLHMGAGSHLLLLCHCCHSYAIHGNKNIIELHYLYNRKKEIDAIHHGRKTKFNCIFILKNVKKMKI